MLLNPGAVSGLEVTSIHPEVAFVGSPVTIIGGPFSEQVRVSLADQQVRPLLVSDKQLMFTVPPLPVGAEFVNNYQMIILGKKFFHNSVLVINEYPAGFADLLARQRFIPAQRGDLVVGRSR